MFNYFWSILQLCLWFISIPKGILSGILRKRIIKFQTFLRVSHKTDISWHIWWGERVQYIQVFAASGLATATANTVGNKHNVMKHINFLSCFRLIEAINNGTMTWVKKESLETASIGLAEAGLFRHSLAQPVHQSILVFVCSQLSSWSQHWQHATFYRKDKSEALVSRKKIFN